ncbi:hypothetical protein M5689_012601 [Euphorbia peplus]|nr:hypothetical protein M5689_012601 [Euphorbia peplus]
MEEFHDDEVKMAELIALREELYRAKDKAMQSWLDSKPLIDELEKLQTDLSNAKNRISMLNMVISELESQLDATKSEIKVKTDEEAKLKKMIDETNESHRELQLFDLNTDVERKARSKMKQILRMRRQTLRTFLLTLQAIKMETEAFEASMGEAIGWMKSSEMENSVVRIGQREFYVLKRRAKEEEALLEWRVSVSAEQKLAAEETRNFALSRLKEIRRSKEEMVINEKLINSEEVEDEQGNCSSVREEDVKRRNGLPKARAEEIAKYNGRNANKKTRRGVKMNKKNKLSFISRIRIFLIRSFNRFFR